MRRQAPSGPSSEPGAVAYAVLLGAQAAVGSAALWARLGLDAGTPPILLAAWRLTVAAAVVVAALRLARGSGTPGAAPDGRQLLSLLAAGLFLGLHFAAWFASLERVSVARATLLVATTPVWAGLAGWLLLGHRLPRLFWPGLAVAGAGMLLVTGARWEGTAVLAGDLLALAGAALVAFYLLTAQLLQPRLGPPRLVAWTYSLAALLLWPLAALETSGRLVPVTSAPWLSIVGLALVPQLIGHTAMNWSLGHFGAGVVAAATLLEPVFAAGLAWWLLAEPVTPMQGAGAVLVLAGVLMVLRRDRPGAGEGRGGGAGGATGGQAERTPGGRRPSRAPGPGQK